MHITERFIALRMHLGHAGCNDCGECEHCERVEEHLDVIHAEIEELLARVPARDTTPAHITLTAS